MIMNYERFIETFFLNYKATCFKIKENKITEKLIRKNKHMSIFC